MNAFATLGVYGSVDSAAVLVNIAAQAEHKSADDGASRRIASGWKARAKKGHTNSATINRDADEGLRGGEYELKATISQELGGEMGQKHNKSCQLSRPSGTDKHTTINLINNRIRKQTNAAGGARKGITTIQSNQMM